MKKQITLTKKEVDLLFGVINAYWFECDDKIDGGLEPEALVEWKHDQKECEKAYNLLTKKLEAK